MKRNMMKFMNSVKKAVNFCINLIRNLCRRRLPSLKIGTRIILYIVTVTVTGLTLLQVSGDILPETVGYFVYGAAVVLLIFSLPYAYRDLIRGFRFLIESNAVTRKFFHDAGYQVVFTTIFSMGINLAYMIYNAVWGILNHSPWFITLAVYYSFLGGIRAYSMYKKRKAESAEDERKARQKELLVMRRDGIFLLLITIDLMGMILLTITEDTVEASSAIHAITIAFFTFYKIGAAVSNMIKVKRLNSPILTAVRNIGLADALVSLLSLQAVMLVSMETAGNRHFINVMNGSTGLAVFGVIFLLGVWMIWNAGKKLKQ